jgi:hypothetical protein
MSPSAWTNPYTEMSREQLLEALQMFAKSWLAHDGCWFLAAEAQHGIDVAIDLDTRAWERFAKAEAHRIVRGYGIEAGGGLEALERALSYRMYSMINEQHVEWSADRSKLRFFMDVCRVQETRRRKGMDDFPCKVVGIAEFTSFAATVDPRIRTRCLHCPPDTTEGKYCGWEFSLGETEGGDTRD